jgi:hypothetical protein
MKLLGLLKILLVILLASTVLLADSVKDRPKERLKGTHWSRRIGKRVKYMNIKDGLNRRIKCS